MWRYRAMYSFGKKRYAISGAVHTFPALMSELRSLMNIFMVHGGMTIELTREDREKEEVTETCQTT